MRPTIGGIVTRAVPIKDDKYVIIMRIPKSWAGPHQIGQLGSFRFFGRGSNGKYQLYQRRERMTRGGSRIAKSLNR